jgi:aromatic ring-opening dioxygenase catalytic subunit (LigB family)
MNFEQLLKERASEHLEDQLSPELAQERWDRCQRAIDSLGETLREVKPDVAVIVGDDQHECFVDDNMPALSVYWGESILTAPQEGNSHEYGGNPKLSRYPLQPTDNPGVPELGLHIIKSLVDEEFDPAHSKQLPRGRKGNYAIGHAFSYIYRRIMNDDVVPNVPVFLNTYFPPNQPSLNRCYELGRALRRAIESWDSDQRVALVASGGLSHVVIEEDLDQQIIEGLVEKDVAKLTSLPAIRFMNGTSEIRNWIVVAGAMDESDRQAEMLDYVPCYRSEAGTGCAMGFTRWQ